MLPGRAVRGGAVGRLGAVPRCRGVLSRCGFVAGPWLPATRPVVPRTRVVAGILIGPGQRLVEFGLVELRRVERLPPAPVRQRQPGRGPHVHGGDLGPPLPGRVCEGRPRGHQVGPQPVHVERRTHRCDLAQRGVGQHHAGQQPLRGHDPRGQPRLGLLPAGGEPGRVGVAGEPPAHHLAA